MKFSVAVTSALAAIASSAFLVEAESSHSTILSRRGQPGKLYVQQHQAAFKALSKSAVAQDIISPDQGRHRLDQGAQMTSNAKPASAQEPHSANNFVGGADPDSPPYYPSPQTKGKGKWAPAIAKAKELVGKLTTEEKVVLTTGAGWASGKCVGNINPIERVGFPGLCLEDSPLGIRFADLVTVFPSGITTAATFSSKLAYKRGVAMGQEHRAKGVNIQLGPGMNMLRAPTGGRNWEMSGADPYLTGEAAYHTIRGVQSQGVQANAKHYIGNEQEHYRETSSSNIDDRTQREIYEHPFLRSVQADVASVMCSYNLVNNSWACQNSDNLNKRLKTEMNFPGYVMSDWGATHSGVSAANAGLDMTMPGDLYCCYAGQTSSYFGKNLTTAVNNGSVTEARLDDMATRILAGWYLLGQDQNYPTPNFDAFASQNATDQEHINVMATSHSRTARHIVAAGTVVLKNKNHALPLNKPKKLALIGSDAGPARHGSNFYSDRGGVDGILGTGWGSGTADYAYLVSPYEAISQRAQKDHTAIYWTFDDYNYGGAQSVATNADAALVFLQSDSGEGYITVDNNAGDRNNLTAWHEGDTLVKQVAAVNPNTIVVIHAPAQLDLEEWINHPNVTAVVWAGMPGSEAGNGLVDVLYGDVNPSGRIPFTIAKSRNDYSADVTYMDNAQTPQIYYSEGLLVDYRHFDSKNIEPRYPFGHGLSYTKFSYTNAKGKWIGDKNTNAKVEVYKGKAYPDFIFDDVYEVSFTVKNTGSRDGYEVPQVYLAFPSGSGEPPKVLRKFDRFEIAKGESKTVTFKLNAYDLSTWDVTKQKWLRPKGQTQVLIGASSRDIRQTFTI
ncbi:glycoside hydrolase family 3 protein [Tilletiaria anomala UBC 951]|uniref:beta-glucosidase n=1 Tax=Tilletiaria anomala (strain ATCC 24038 / CBS 436.72 / UBC 951) TaxID=1037660 RepID=A0A066W224_TILAU|nr:glycoside hydrolase family 3 protein [Tilletiaria anomala UBC 951]KDN47766.1 glycoside hydrolase family 3 protein [Tilletiaria anomala UBC 951]